MPKQVSKQVSNSNPSNHHHLLCLAIRNSELKTAPRCLGLSPIRSRDPSSSSARAQSQHSKKNKCVTVCVCVCVFIVLPHEFSRSICRKCCILLRIILLNANHETYETVLSASLATPCPVLHLTQQRFGWVFSQTPNIRRISMAM